ncbi:MAG: hypothetical protein WAN65_01135 [Candidatus Sulfotelmatobacter sp.]
MRLFGNSRCVSVASLVCGLFLMTGALQATTTTWTVENGSLYASGDPTPVADLTGSFTFDGTVITSINLSVYDTFFPTSIPFTNTSPAVPLAGNSIGLTAWGDNDCECYLNLLFDPALTSAGGTANIGANSTYNAIWWYEEEDVGPLFFDGAYVTTNPVPEPVTAGLAILSCVGLAGLAIVRRQRATKS